MIVISGCPRSGTSLMMDLMRIALGDDRIIGKQWPQEREHENACVNAYAEHVKTMRNPGWRKQLAETKAMNPNGFYECHWTVQGIQYTPDSPPEDHAAKIVSQGLARSNPAYIDKIILMVRHPWAVAKSHCNLVTQVPIHSRNKDLGGADPEMYVRVTAMAAAWIQQHRPDLLLVNFDELIGNPDDILTGIEAFIGDGDWQTARKQIQPKLKRSKPEKAGDTPVWDVALEIHDMLLKQDWQGIIDRQQAYEQAKPKPVQFFCTRWGGQVNRGMCEACYAGGDTAANMRKTAEKRRIDWRNEPCGWECGMNPDRDTYTPISIEESIACNHWRTESTGLGDTIAKITDALHIPKCGGCKKRQAKLNKLAPYKDTP